MRERDVEIIGELYILEENGEILKFATPPNSQYTFKIGNITMKQHTKRKISHIFVILFTFHEIISATHTPFT